MFTVIHSNTTHTHRVKDTNRQAEINLFGPKTDIRAAFRSNGTGRLSQNVWKDGERESGRREEGKKET